MDEQAVLQPPNNENDDINADELIQRGQALTELPDEAREWLRSYGPTISGTDVPTRLTENTSDGGEAHGKPTLLTILSKWISAWFINLEKARRESRVSRTSTTKEHQELETPSKKDVKPSRSNLLKEQKDLDWVLRLTRDFIGLSKAHHVSSEISESIRAITRICLRTNEQNDINNSIGVLDAILEKFNLPDDVLEETLSVLSASAAILQEQPANMHHCFHLILQGSSNSKAVSCLFSFIRTPSSENDAKNLSQARGATRLLREALDLKLHTGDFAIVLESLVNVLREVSEKKIFRFGFDILNTCSALLGVSDRRSELLSLDWNLLMDIISTSLIVAPTATKAIGNSASTLSPSNEGEHDRHQERHLKERVLAGKAIDHRLEVLWPSLSTTQQQIVHDYYLSFPQYLSTVQSFEVMIYLESHQLLYPTQPDWRTRYSKTMKDFICNPIVPPTSRVKAVNVLLNACRYTIKYSDDAASTASKIQMKHFIDQVVTDTFEQTFKEQDRTICEALVLILAQIATALSTETQSDVVGLQIIKKLKSYASFSKELNDIDEDRTFLVTKALAGIFLRTLHNHPQHALTAYEALLNAAAIQCQSRRSRVFAMRLLFKLRANSLGFIYVQSRSDVDYIAAALCRTREALDTFDFDSFDEKRGSESSTSLSTKSNIREQLWIYPEADDLSFYSNGYVSTKITVDTAAGQSSQGILQLDITSWLLHVIRCLQSDGDWETYSYVLVHLGSQLSNIKLFSGSMHTIVKLRQILCEQIVNATFREPPASTGLKKSDTALCMFNIITPLIPYATMRNEQIQKGFGDDLVRAFLSGIGGTWEGTSRGCIHALSICSLEIPYSVASLYPSIVDKLSKNMTQSHLTIHILEFLAQVARLPEVHSNFNQNEIITIFGICIQFLEKFRDQHQSTSVSQPARIGTPARHSGLSLRRPPYRAAMLTDVGLPQYAAALAYHSMIFWFLSLKLEIRSKAVSWIVPRLIWKNSRGEETIDEQSQVFIDMMQRAAFSDLGETSPDPEFAEKTDGAVSSASWAIGLSILTAETASHTGHTQIIKRQASGTTYAKYKQLTTELPPHHAPSHTEIRSYGVDTPESTEILPSHILLQMVATAASINVADQPVPLPKEEWVTRALEIFDRNPTVDSHKIGVLFIGNGQVQEEDFLPNTKGSADYERFLSELGYKTSLKPPIRFNSHGLQYPQDGQHTIAWRDRVTEIICHVATMMPTDMDEDRSCVGKKAHVGNCHVNVVFNRSGLEWKLNNLKSQLNYVNIVISPANSYNTLTGSEQSVTGSKYESRGSSADRDHAHEADHHIPDSEELPNFYKVQVITKDDFPNISLAADPKIISASQLPQLVRVMALNANVFSQAWNVKDYDSEFPSSWRSRLQQIKQLKERAIAKLGRQEASEVTGGIISPSSSRSHVGERRPPVQRDDSQNVRRDGHLATQLDFSKWIL